MLERHKALMCLWIQRGKGPGTCMCMCINIIFVIFAPQTRFLGILINLLRILEFLIPEAYKQRERDNYEEEDNL